VQINWRSGEIDDSISVFIGPNRYVYSYSEPTTTPITLKLLLLTQFRIYQMYLSSQSSVLIVVLNQAIPQCALNLH